MGPLLVHCEIARAGLLQLRLLTTPFARRGLVVSAATAERMSSSRSCVPQIFQGCHSRSGGNFPANVRPRSPILLATLRAEERGEVELAAVAAAPEHGLTTFDSTKEGLQDLLKSVRVGKTQLPDFQRSWVWDDDRIRGLLASISLSYPIGAVMLLQAGNPSVRFGPRLVQGVSLPLEIDPERLILDGQQRLTALYQALLSGQVADTTDVRGKPIRRWYYVDIRKALDEPENREDAIISIPEDRITRNFRGEAATDYSTVDKECGAEMLPLPLVFDTPGLTRWQMRYLRVNPEQLDERLERWNRFVEDVIQRFQQYQVPVIFLRKETPKIAVCQVFEKVNTGGVPLTVFDLLTATYAADGFNLRIDWAARHERLRKHAALRGLEGSDFLTAVTLLASLKRKKVTPASAVGCKRKDILELGLAEYTSSADEVENGLVEAAKFLHWQKVFNARDLPYRTQLVPLCAIFAALGHAAETDRARTLLGRWYWCGVFGELYGGAIETRFAKDLPEVVAWIEGGGQDPQTVQDSTFAPTRLLGMQSRNSAAYKGLSALLLRDGALDFRTGKSMDEQLYFDEKVDIHHIFPKTYCEKKGLDRKNWNSVINKTPLSARTNRIIGGNAPSVYLGRLESYNGMTPSRMNDILVSHVIDPAYLRADEFDRFISSRQEALLQRIEAATGKPISRAAGKGDDEVIEDDEEEEVA